MPAADDLRRVLRRAGRRPRAVLRGFWAGSGPPGGANDRRSGEPIPAGSARSRLLAAVLSAAWTTVGAGDGKGGDLRRCRAGRHRRQPSTSRANGGRSPVHRPFSRPEAQIRWREPARRSGSGAIFLPTASQPPQCGLQRVVRVGWCSSKCLNILICVPGGFSDLEAPPAGAGNGSRNT